MLKRVELENVTHSSVIDARCGLRHQPALALASARSARATGSPRARRSQCSLVDGSISRGLSSRDVRGQRRHVFIRDTRELDGEDG